MLDATSDADPHTTMRHDRARYRSKATPLTSLRPGRSRRTVTLSQRESYRRVELPVSALREPKDLVRAGGHLDRAVPPAYAAK